MYETVTANDDGTYKTVTYKTVSVTILYMPSSLAVTVLYMPSLP